MHVHNLCGDWEAQHTIFANCAGIGLSTLSYSDFRHGYPVSNSSTLDPLSCSESFENRNCHVELPS